MMEHFEYIDDFFKSTPTEEQKKEFDQKIISDPSFAEDVAFYLSAAQTARDLLAEEKKENFRQLYKQSAPPETINIKTPVRHLWKYLAAAVVIAGLVIGRILFFAPATPVELANNYITEKFTKLDVNMGSGRDSIQMGRELYNSGKLKEALAQFESILSNDTSNFLAKKYAGITSLELNQFDKALLYFHQMAIEPGYYSNPGKFYEALTLIKRNGPNDKEEAKKILQEVVDQNLDESETAKKWLQDL